MKKVLLINGHPNPDSFNFALVAAYRKGAEQSGAAVQQLNIAELEFSPNLKFGYQKRTELEPDLLAAWEQIKWADHLVWVHPVWWGGLPALLKGFIDRLFLPGFAFQYRENSVWWDKLLTGKTARILTTLDQPGWFYRLFYGRPSINQLKRSTLQFTGVDPVRVSIFGPIRNSKLSQREKWLEQTAKLGARLR
ncbi:MAG: NAD(P)H-dependent oxidoreductase [Bacteroidota bacterium]